MSTPDVSLVLVCYRSSAVAPAAVASFRREVAAAGLTGEVVLVDHSESPAEASALGELAPDRLVVQGNRGYAAGINAGVAVARGGVLLVGNPDIELAEGGLPSLLETLARGFDIAGPLFVCGRWLFPPADLQTPGALLRQWWASGGAGRWRRELRSEVRRWMAVWQAREPVAVRFLTGALVACSRRAWDRLGPWDEGYFLYFEETDWLVRAARLGMRIALDPRARVTHLWAHAADPAAQARTVQSSRARYLRQCFGWRGRLVTGLMPRAPGWPPGLATSPAEVPADAAFWLLSPSPLGMPALLFEGSGRPGAEDLAAMQGGARGGVRFSLLAVSRATGEPLGVWSVQ
ncbi:MAG: glycosyltransferase [Thermoanaerobaculaceae bacterium]|jgi:GT2 family glycosyltransferase|nr:glycosyltransferase [Thermoanaerobaculaceae bacterium]